MSKDLSGIRILVSGATGFLGRFVVSEIKALGGEVIAVSKSGGWDLRNEVEAIKTVVQNHPDVIVHLAGVVGGIGANMRRPGTFFRDNMLIGMGMVEAAAISKVKLVTVGTVCSYPRDCPTPFREETFWEGFPEPTNAPYGIAKKALLVMMQAYRKEFGLKFAYLVPTNLYGPGDHFEEERSHVVPALIKRFSEAKERKLKEVTCWGTGQATRSFLYVGDAAQAIVRACTEVDYDDIINLPGSEEIKMTDLSRLIAGIIGYEGAISWDKSKPDGQPRRLSDGERSKKILGWQPMMEIEEGLRRTIEWYQKEYRQV